MALRTQGANENNTEPRSRLTRICPSVVHLVLSGLCEMKKLKVLISVLDAYETGKSKPDWVEKYGAEFDDNRRKYAEKRLRLLCRSRKFDTWKQRSLE